MPHNNRAQRALLVTDFRLYRTKKFLINGLCWLWLIGTGVCPSVAQSQPKQADGIRQVPAPWRPSFGGVAGGPSNDNTRNAGASPAATPDQPASIVNRPPPQEPGGPNANGRPNLATGPGSPASADSRLGSLGSDTRRADVRPGITRVSKTLNQLPQQAGQVWREYDISPYTSQVTATDHPEKAVLDWILRETGTELWFTEPMGVLNVDNNKVYVYHTPEIQAVVKGIIDRFVRTRGQVQKFDVNLVTIAKPNWRSQAYTMLQPIEVKSPGVEAWLVSKENAAILMGQLRRRADFKIQSAGRLNNHDGQAFALNNTRPVQFIRSLRWTPGQVPNYQPLLTTVNEGFNLEISCLTTMDNASIEATIRCDVDQVEKLNDVKVAVPSVGGQRDVNLQIPQMVSWRLHERFRWPSDEVLLLSCGVVATPAPDSQSGGIRLPAFGNSKRADALLFIDYRGPAQGATIPTVPDSGAARTAGRLGQIRN